MIAHVSAIFLLPVLEKSVISQVIFIDFRAIVHSISAREGGNTVCWKAMVRKKTDDDSVTYWFPWKHPVARRRGLEFGIFDQTPPKMGSSARPYGPCRSIFFPPQNYNSQSIGSALRASPFASFAAFARKHNPNVGSVLWASPLGVANALGANFSPFRCPPHGLRHAALDSDHAECCTVLQFAVRVDIKCLTFSSIYHYRVICLH